MPDAFVSYSRRNKDFVQKLVKSLIDDNRDVWIDWEDIPVTADWLEEIYQGIRESDAFIFVITPDSVQSEVCGWELKYALENKKRLIPILHEEIVEDEDKKAMHSAVSSHNWIFFREQDDYNAMFQLLRDALDTDLEHVREHTRILVRAKQWETRDHARGFLISGDELIEAEQWLSKAADKDPEPTELQMQYVYESRKATNRRQQTIVAASLFAAGISIALAILAGIFYLNAEENRQEAEQQRENAERNAEEAESLALAANAQLALALNDNDLAIALGLASTDVEQATQLETPPQEAQQILQDAVYAPGTRAILRGHEGVVSTVAYHPDGDVVLSGGEDGALIVWDAATGAEMRRLDGHEAGVTSVVLNADGSRVLSTAQNGTATVWDVESGDTLATFTADGEGIAFFSGAINADGTQVLTGDGNGVVTLWDVESGDLITAFEDWHTNRIDGLAFSPDGTQFASGSWDETFTIYNLDTEEAVRVETDGRVTDVEFESDGSTLLTSSGDFSVYTWDATTGEPVQSFGGHLQWVNAATYDDEGRFILSAARDNTVRLWNVAFGEQMIQFGGHTERVTDVDFSPDGNRAVSASEDGTLRLLDLEYGRQVARLDGHGGNVVATVFSADGQTGYTGAWDATIRSWDIATGTENFALNSSELGGSFILSLALSPQEDLIVASYEDVVRVWNLETQSVEVTYEGHVGGFIYNTALSPDQNFAATGSFGEAYLWDVNTGETIHELTGHADIFVDDVDFTADGETVMVASAAGIILYSVETGEITNEITPPENISAARFNADDSGLLVVVGDTVVLIDLETENVLYRFEGHSADINGLDFSTDGQYVLTGANDNTIRLWDATTGNELQRINYVAAVQSVALSPDSTLALTGAEDYIARLWNITPPPLDEVRTWASANRVSGEFTCNQVERFGLEDRDVVTQETCEPAPEATTDEES